MKTLSARLPHLAGFLLGFCGTFYLVLLGGFAWKGQSEPAWAGLIVSAAACGGWLLWRSWRGDRVFRTGLEAPLLLGGAALFFSLAVSPDRRLGLERLGWLGFYPLLFYLLISAFRGGLPPKTTLWGLLAASGMVAALAVMEAYAWYTRYWAAGGAPFSLPPTPYRLYSLLSHANAFMGFANLCAPLALTFFTASRRRGAVFAAGLWLAFYGLSILAASSRGGLIGTAAWGAAWLGLLAWEKGWWQVARRWGKGRRRLALGLLLAGLGLAAAAGYSLFAYFSAHPTHAGSGFFGNRQPIWENALQVWQAHPLSGAGPGRFAFAYLEAEPNVPPAFWAGYAHSLFFQWLAEFGLAGVLALLAGLGCGAAWAWRAYHRLPNAERPWGRAILAAFAGWLAHSVVEDFSTFLPHFAILALLAACLGWRECPPARKRISIGLLGLPAALLAAFAAWTLWGYQPYASSLPTAEKGDWQTAARLVAESARRDPALALYPTLAGLSWGQAWGQSQDPHALAHALAQARAALRASLEIEPAYSLSWANLAALDFQAGDPNTALEHMRRAALLAPSQAVYPLNLGWYAEQAGSRSEAERFYRQALALNPAWRSHPFWQRSELRQNLLQSLDPLPPALPAYWQQANSALEKGDLAAARFLLAQAEASGEPNLALLALRGRLAEAAGSPAAARQAYEQIAGWLTAPTLEYDNGAAIQYAGIFNRAALPVSAAPGLLRLYPDVGQFTALERLAELQAAAGEAAQAEYTRRLLEAARRGGELVPGSSK